MLKKNSLLIFLLWLIITAVAVFAVAKYQSYQADHNPEEEVSNQPAISIPGSNLTMEEVAKHGTESDCWMVINNKVYDVTKATAQHPGGADAIIRYCGQEATQAFDTKDMGKPHSQKASDMLQNYYLGDLKR